MLQVDSPIPQTSKERDVAGKMWMVSETSSVGIAELQVFPRGNRAVRGFRMRVTFKVACYTVSVISITVYSGYNEATQGNVSVETN